MADRHRPLITKHGTHCICGVFCGFGRNVQSWERHVWDVATLNDDVVPPVDPSPIGEAWWNILLGFDRINQAHFRAAKRLAQAFAPQNQESFTKIDGGSGS